LSQGGVQISVTGRKEVGRGRKNRASNGGKLSRLHKEKRQTAWVGKKRKTFQEQAIWGGKTSVGL